MICQQFIRVHISVWVDLYAKRFYFVHAYSTAAIIHFASLRFFLSRYFEDFRADFGDLKV